MIIFDSQVLVYREQDVARVRRILQFSKNKKGGGGGDKRQRQQRPVVGRSDP